MHAQARLWLVVLVVAGLAPACKSSGQTADAEGADRSTSDIAVQPEEMKLGPPCGDMSGLQPGSPWPLALACPARRSRSAFSGPDEGVVKWTYWSLRPLGSPVVAADGTVYLLVGKKGLVALAPDGKEKWTFAWPGVEDDYSISGMLALASDGTIILPVIGDERLLGVTPDGEKKWEWESADFSTGPAITAGGIIIVGANETLSAFNPDGTTAWEFEAPEEDHCEDSWMDGLPAVAPDGTILAPYSSCPDHVYALTSDGKLKWSFEMDGERVSPVAVGEDGSVYFPAEDGALHAYSAVGEFKWKSEALGDPDWEYGGPPPAIGADGTIYLTRANQLAAVDANGEILWQITPAKGGKRELGPPIIDGRGVVFVSSEGGSIIAISDQGEILSTMDIQGESPATLLIGTDWTLYALWFGYNSGDRTFRLVALAPCYSGCREEQCAFGICVDVCKSCGDIAECKPDCVGADCGPDGCRGSCGDCVEGSVCVLGQCLDKEGDECGSLTCTPYEQCSDKLDSCVNKMVEIPAGPFWMGCNNAAFPPADADCSGTEIPYHQVAVSSYEIDLAEVTAAQYSACVGAGGCEKVVSEDCLKGKTNLGKPGKGNHPMNCVTWSQALDYCQWVCPECRLCTEAEWEKAARGGCEFYEDCKLDSAVYPWGDSSEGSNLANCSEDSQETVPVGSYPLGVSPYGLHDMAGNVEEWVNDKYAFNYYCKGSKARNDDYSPTESCEPEDTPHPDACDNPTGPSGGFERVVRGGRFGYIDSYCRNSLRSWGDGAEAADYLGFRCCSNP